MKLIENLTNWFVKNKWLILGFSTIVLINYFYLNKTFSIHFVDEEDNLVLGHFLLQGQKLYSDLFSHHQPLAYIISAAFQFITQPENIYMLIKRHREFMITYSLFWSVILIWRFKERVILPLIVYEVSKFYLLGQLFLSESLAIYPILFLTLFLFEKQKPKIFEFFTVGFLISISALLLAPVWPFLAAYVIFLYVFKKPSFKQIGVLIGGIIIPVLITLPFIDIYYYFHNVFYINFKYYIPQSGEAKFPLSLILGFLTPITALFTKGDFASISFILKIICVVFIIAVGFLIKTKNYRLLLVAITLLTLSNIRYFAPGLEYYSGFHILIWYGIFILISFYFFLDFLKTFKKKIKVLLVIFMLTLVGAIIISSKELLEKKDINHDYYVNYLEQNTYGEAIKTMRDEDDTLFVIEDEWLLYFQGDIKNNNKMVNFYGWMSLVWELGDPVVDKFKTDPPEFFYCECDEKRVLSYSENYHQMIRDGAKTQLWVLKDKFASLTNEQKDKLRFLHFQLE